MMPHQIVNTFASFFISLVEECRPTHCMCFLGFFICFFFFFYLINTCPWLCFLCWKNILLSWYKNLSFKKEITNFHQNEYWVGVWMKFNKIYQWSKIILNLDFILILFPHFIVCFLSCLSKTKLCYLELPQFFPL